MSCPGAESCRLAVTQSRGLGRELTEYLDVHPEFVALVNDGDIKISGCPNGCGQHHIAAIGFQGSVRKVGDKALPQYFVLVGGGSTDEGAKFGRVVSKVPVRRLTTAVDRLLTLYQERREPAESLGAFFRRIPPAVATAALRDLAELQPGETIPDDFIDLGETHAFETDRDGRGVRIVAGTCLGPSGVWRTHERRRGESKELKKDQQVRREALQEMARKSFRTAPLQAIAIQIAIRPAATGIAAVVITTKATAAIPSGTATTACGLASVREALDALLVFTLLGRRWLGRIGRGRRRRLRRDGWFLRRVDHQPLSTIPPIIATVVKFESLDPEIRGVLGKKVSELGLRVEGRRSKATSASCTSSSSAAG